MKIKEAIILAGGFGTRLKGLLNGLPKPMADVNGSPFLAHLINYIVKQCVNRIIISTGYNGDVIKKCFVDFKDAEIIFSHEEEPLGTGGGIKKALNLIRGTDAFVFNGDTFYLIDLGKLAELHHSANADLTIALRQMDECSRYDSMVLNKAGRINEIRIRKGGPGIINGGIYILRKNILDTLPDKFSLENDFLTKKFDTLNFYGKIFNNYFIDIGVPEDYERSKKEFKKLDTLS